MQSRSLKRNSKMIFKKKPVCMILHKHAASKYKRELDFAQLVLISVSVSSPSLFLNQYAPHQAFDCFSVYCTVAHLF